MKLHETGVYYQNGKVQTAPPAGGSAEAGRCGTIAYGILKAHNTADSMQELRLKYDSMTSHDITYVGIIQTARASGMERFPLPYVMTNCHNSLCAVGGTINEDDHRFALSAAHKYGGIYVPPNMAVIHSYNREMMSGCGRMILGSDSHTRYGALGTLAVGEGGGELAKQLVGRTYDMTYPGVVAVYLTGKPNPGVGPHDVALALVGATYANGYVKNKVMEFIGPGVANLSADYRNGIDVMTTETTCWSSVWQTDEVTKQYFAQHGRPEAYKELKPAEGAYYDGCIELDLSTVECMIALPMHPSYAYPIREVKANAKDILHEIEQQANRQLGGKVQMDLLSKICPDGRIYVDQGIVAGCSGGTFENICAVADLVKGRSCGNGAFKLSVYPDSMPTYLELVKNGAVADIVSAGGIFRECFCGPCFGAGDTPANGELSIRHTTRNFPNREGSKPGEGQISAVALMDARSIAATAANGGLGGGYIVGVLAGQRKFRQPQRVGTEGRCFAGGDQFIRRRHRVGDVADHLDQQVLAQRRLGGPVLDVGTKAQGVVRLRLAPAVVDALFVHGSVKMVGGQGGFAVADLVPAAKAVQALDTERRKGDVPAELQAVYEALQKGGYAVDVKNTNVGSTIYANKPGDGSAREQAASCQRVLGAGANIVTEYATKRYRSNLINWGMLPLQLAGATPFGLGDYVLIPNVREALKGDLQNIKAYVLGDTVKEFSLYMAPLTTDERQILADGCLINFYKH